MSNGHRAHFARDFREAIDLVVGEPGARSAPRPEPTPSPGADPYGNADPEWLRIDWGPHLRRHDIAGATINYVEAGASDGPPVLLIHGLDGCWQNWLETIPHLARSRRVLAVDLPGFGHSPLPDWEISIDNYRNAILEFLDAVEVERADLIGNSMGGLVAVECAQAAPERIARLVLVSPAGISSADVRSEPAVIAGRLLTALTPLWKRFQAAALRRPRLLESAFGTIFHKPRELRRELLFEHHRNGGGRPGFLAAVAAVAGHRPTAALERLEIPTLIVWGRDDLVLPAADALQYDSRLPDGQTVIMDATGHLPQLERPARFNRLLDAFLDGDRAE